MLDPITRLNAALEGRYRIESELGEGGMATVYLADDLKHERKVALKVLKPELAAVVGAERFLAEIKTTANLQHPHILPLFDSGEADSFLFYVMPFVEGESLRQRLNLEYQLPVDNAVRIATDLAEALGDAHAQGVIHRDLKPANILIHAGRPLIADFGIALAVGAAGGGRLTETGLSLGTPHYMSPEQATGDSHVGPASDIYALGCVLYEMLVGEPPFTGRSAQAVLAKILIGEIPAPTAARASIPAHVDATIRRSLERLPADRFVRAEDFAGALANAGFRHGKTVEPSEGGASDLWKWVSMAATSVAFVSVAVSARVLLSPNDPTALEVIELSFQEGQRMTDSRERTLSVDGETLVYMSQGEESPSQLWVRHWDDPRAEAQPIPRTENAITPAISPDGRQLAFAQDGMIKVLSFEGGPPLSHIEGSHPAWGPDGYLYATYGKSLGVLRVPATGGAADTLSHLIEGEIQHIVTDFLPNGWPLLTVINEVGTPNEIRVIDLRTREIRPLVSGAFPTYTSTGHLLYLADGATLTASRVDKRTMEVVGAAVPIYDDVLPGFDLSATGKLIYTVDPNAGEEAPDELVWIDRTGRATALGFSFHRGGVSGFGWSLSPDGSRIALRHAVSGNRDIWVKRLPDGPFERLTVGEESNDSPGWAPDGLSVTYVAESEGVRSVWSASADGGGAPRRVHGKAGVVSRGTWSPDGSWLVTSAETGGDIDIVAVRPGLDSVVSLVATEFWEITPSLSPDGRWLAYSSDRTGRFEVYVQPFPDVGSARVRVSTEGGRAPAWAHSGRELFFRDANAALVSAKVEIVAGFRVVDQEVLFAIPPGVATSGGVATLFDVSLDDQKFLMGRRRPRDNPRTFLVNNFLEELNRLVPN